MKKWNGNCDVITVNWERNHMFYMDLCTDKILFEIKMFLISKSCSHCDLPCWFFKLGKELLWKPNFALQPFRLIGDWKLVKPELIFLYEERQRLTGTIREKKLLFTNFLPFLCVLDIIKGFIWKCNSEHEQIFRIFVLSETNFDRCRAQKYPIGFVQQHGYLVCQGQLSPIPRM